MTLTLMEVGSTTGSAPVLKCVPEDFAVRETLLVELVDEEELAQRQYLILRKKGFTTMEAIRLVAGHFGLPTASVTYGGLKDEDGVTEQLIAIPVGIGLRDTSWYHTDGSDRYLSLQHYGFGVDELNIGGLQGNAFRIVLRNFVEADARNLAGTGKINHVYLNYYDTQRFGVPGGPKRTHYVGAAMSAQQWECAREELVGLQSPESEDAREWTGGAEEYFKSLDWRTSSFFLSAHGSAAWNQVLCEAVAEAAGESAFDVTIDGMVYRYVDSSEAAVKVMDHCLELPFRRLVYRDGEFSAKVTKRASVVQTTIDVGKICEDTLFPGRYQVELRLFLPSGSYATAAVRQLLGRISRTGGKAHGEPV
jgi:tRNA pseudouridine13 synthase